MADPITIKDVLREGPVEITPDRRWEWADALGRCVQKNQRDDGYWYWASTTVTPIEDLNALLARTQSLLRAEWEKEQEAKYGPLVEALESLIDYLDLASYCECCKKHAPKSEEGELIGDIPHEPDCILVAAKDALAVLEGDKHA